MGPLCKLLEPKHNILIKRTAFSISCAIASTAYNANQTGVSETPAKTNCHCAPLGNTTQACQREGQLSLTYMGGGHAQNSNCLT